MAKQQGNSAYKGRVYRIMQASGYNRTYEEFNAQFADPTKAGELWQELARGKHIEEPQEVFLENLGFKKEEDVKKKDPSSPLLDQKGMSSSPSSVEKSPLSEQGKKTEQPKTPSWGGIIRTIQPSKEPSSTNSKYFHIPSGPDAAAMGRIAKASQLERMQKERPDATIVEVESEGGKTFRFLDDHKDLIKKRVSRVPDATFMQAPVEDVVNRYYEQSPKYKNMVEVRKQMGYGNTYNQGKYVLGGLDQMQRDLKDGIDLAKDEIDKDVFDKYTKVTNRLEKLNQNSVEFQSLAAQYQSMINDHPELESYEDLVSRFWAVDQKKAASMRDPRYKEYIVFQQKKEAAQQGADMFAKSTKFSPTQVANLSMAPLPQAAKEAYDLAQGVVRAGATLRRWVTGDQYSSLDHAVEWIEQNLNPQLNAKTATPSNRRKLTGQEFVEVDGAKVMLEKGVVQDIADAQGYTIRDQATRNRVMAKYEANKNTLPVKSQTLNLPSAFDVMVGGAIQLATSVGTAGLASKTVKVLGAGKKVTALSSKSASVATNTAQTYNKLYESALMELGPDKQDVAEKYAFTASVLMSSVNTLINPLEQQILGQVSSQTARSLARELSEGVAEQTAIRNAVRTGLKFTKTLGKEGVLEGGIEAVLDGATKEFINEKLLKGDVQLDFDPIEDIKQNVVEETLGALFSSTIIATRPTQVHRETLDMAYSSPNRAKMLAKIGAVDKKAQSHYEEIFAQADIMKSQGKEPNLMMLHQDKILATRSAAQKEEGFTPSPAAEMPSEPTEPTETTESTTPNAPSAPSVAEISRRAVAMMNPKEGDSITTGSGQQGTIIGFDTDDEPDSDDMPDIDDDETVDPSVRIRSSRRIRVQMNESGDEIVIDSADYNKNIFDNAISELMQNGLSEQEARWSISVAQAANEEGVNFNRIEEMISEEIESPAATVVADDEGERQAIRGAIRTAIDRLGPTTLRTPKGAAEQPVAADDEGERQAIRGAIRTAIDRLGPTTLRTPKGATDQTAGQEVVEEMPPQDASAPTEMTEEAQPMSEPEPMAEPTITSTPTEELTTDATAEQTADPTTATEPAVESVAEPIPEPLAEPLAEPIAEQPPVTATAPTVSLGPTPPAGNALNEEVVTDVVNTPPITLAASNTAQRSDSDKMEAFEALNDGGIALSDITSESTPAAYADLISKLNKAVEAMANFNVGELYLHTTRESMISALKKRSKKGFADKVSKTIKGFFSPYDNSIHFFLSDNLKEVSRIGYHELIHPFIAAVMEADKGMVQKWHKQLTALPEYVEVQEGYAMSIKEFSQGQNYVDAGLVEIEAVVEFFARVANGDIIFKEQSKKGLIDWLNTILESIGFGPLVKNKNVKVWASAVAQALRSGERISRPISEAEREAMQAGGDDVYYYIEEDAEVEFDGTAPKQGIAPIGERPTVLSMEPYASKSTLNDFKYYDRISSLIDRALNENINKERAVDLMVDHFNFNADAKRVVEAMWDARESVAISINQGARRYQSIEPKKGLWGKVKQTFSGFHQKRLVAGDGASLRAYTEGLGGKISEHVDRAQSLIKRVEAELAAQAKNGNVISQDFIDRYVRDDNTQEEKEALSDNFLRKIGASEEFILQYLRGGTTLYQRKRFVEETMNAEKMKVVTPDVIALIDSFIESSMNEEDRKTMPETLAATLDLLRDSIDNLTQTMLDEQMVLGERADTLRDNLGEYMAQVYAIFKDKDFTPTEQAKQDAVRYFADLIKSDLGKLSSLEQEAKLSGSSITELISRDATRMMNDYLASIQKPTAKNTPGVGGKVGKLSTDQFTQRKGVPLELQGLLGRYDPLQEYAYTMNQMANFVEKMRFQRSLRQYGEGLFMFKKNDPLRPIDANYPLDGFTPSIGGVASADNKTFEGMYVSAEVFEMLHALDQQVFTPNPLMSKWLQFQGFVNKMKTVYSYSTHLGNFMGNFFFMGFNGVAPIGVHSKTATAASWRNFWDDYAGNRDMVDEALGVLKKAGVLGTEISTNAIKQTVKHLEDKFGEAKKSGNSLAKFDAALIDLYQQEDNFFKVYLYMVERDRYNNALYGKRYMDSDSVERRETDRLVTEIVKSVLPNFDRMGSLTQSIARNNVLFGNFLPFTFEAARVYANTISLARKEMASPNESIRRIGRNRAMGLVATTLIADAAIMTSSKVAGGIFGLFFSGEDDRKLNKDLRLGVPEFVKNGDLIFSRDKQRGNVYFAVDISSRNPTSLYRRLFNSIAYTPSDSELAQAIGKQVMSTFFDQTIAMKFVTAIMKGKDDRDRMIWDETDSDAEMAEKILLYTAKTIGPGSIGSAVRITQSDEPLRTAAGQAFGLPVYEVDFARVWATQISNYTKSDGTYKLLRDKLVKVANSDVSDAEYEDALDNFNKKRKIALDKLREVKKSMINVGLSKSDVIDIIDESGASKLDKTYLKTGEFFPKYYYRAALLYDDYSSPKN